MTEQNYIDRLDAIRCWMGGLEESVNDGNVSGNDIIEELAGLQSDLAFIIDELHTHDIDELILGAD